VVGPRPRQESDRMAQGLTQFLRSLCRPPDRSLCSSDGELLARFARGHDEAAFAALVARHGPMIHNVCWRVLGDADAAEDAFQPTFVVLARRAGSIGRPAALAAWLYGVASRVARKARSLRQRISQTSAPADAPEPADPRPDPLAILSARDLLRT